MTEHSTGTTINPIYFTGRIREPLVSPRQLLGRYLPYVVIMYVLKRVPRESMVWAGGQRKPARVERHIEIRPDGSFVESKQLPEGSMDQYWVIVKEDTLLSFGDIVAIGFHYGDKEKLPQPFMLPEGKKE